MLCAKHHFRRGDIAHRTSRDRVRENIAFKRSPARDSLAQERFPLEASKDESRVRLMSDMQVSHNLINGPIFRCPTT